MEDISVAQRVVVVLGGELLLAFDGIEYVCSAERGHGCG
jgi:hypothetical protein